MPPIGLTVRVSGSGQTLPKVPWIAVLDPDVAPGLGIGEQLSCVH
jgi:hypothetical protein